MALTNAPAPLPKKVAGQPDAMGVAILNQFDAANAGAPAQAATGIPAPAGGGATDAANAGIPAPVARPTPTAQGGAVQPTAPAPQMAGVDPAMTARPAPAVGGGAVQPVGGGTDTSPGGPTPGGGLETSQPVPIDPGQAMTQAQAAFQSRFNRPMSPQEQQQLLAAVGYTGGAVTPAQMQQAMQLIAQYNAPGATPTGPGTTPTPTGQGTDPNVALNQVQSAFQTRLGRAMTQQEQQALMQAVGYTGGPVTAAQMQQALELVGRYSGNLADPWGAIPGATPTPGGTPAGPAPTPQSLANQRLIDLLNEHWGEVDTDSPAMAAQREAFALANQRDTSRRRAALAERAAARGGLGSGGFDVDTERAISEQGERQSGFEANLVAQELQGQRARLMEGIQIALQNGMQQQAQALQEKLGTLDIELRRYLGRGQLGLGLLGQAQQNQQFYDTLGLNLAQLQNLMNNQAINAIL